MLSKFAYLIQGPRSKFLSGGGLRRTREPKWKTKEGGGGQVAC